MCSCIKLSLSHCKENINYFLLAELAPEIAEDWQQPKNEQSNEMQQLKNSIGRLDYENTNAFISVSEVSALLNFYESVKTSLLLYESMRF